jgi:glycosyltransferase involved in cell wall biosynthesis
MCPQPALLKPAPPNSAAHFTLPTHDYNVLPFQFSARGGEDFDILAAGGNYSRRRAMRILICWPYISGYMTACWRALSAAGGIDLSILAFSTEETAKSGIVGYSDDIVHGLNARLLGPDDRENAELIVSYATSINPDIVVVPGWALPVYNQLTTHPPLTNARFVLTLDTPRRYDWRQRVARFRLRKFLSRFDRAIVAGERAWQLARYLGMPEEKLCRGLYGFDQTIFTPSLHARRLSENNGVWPKSFLFVGRYVWEKAMDTLADAYARYRGACAARGDEPWPLVCCGRGPEGIHIANRPGISDIGYVQPDGLPDVMIRHGVFVLSSRRESWGVAVAEAMAAGLPVICTEAAGGVVELVRPFYNGLLASTENPQSLARAMEWCDQNYDELPEMGRRSIELAAPFSAENWAARWAIWLKDLTA